MAKRNLLRTPEGAWYRGYAGLKPPNYYDHYGYLGPPHNTCREGLYERGAILHGPTDWDRGACTERAMAHQYDGKGAPSYRPIQHYQDARLSWDPEKRNRNLPADFKLYDPHSRNGPAEFKLHDPHTRNSPADLKLFDPHSRNSPADLKLDDPYPRNGPADGKHYDSSPRDGPADGKQYETSRYHGPAERDWELPGRLSPRRIVYEPSFYAPGTSPRNIPPWERDRVQQRSPTHVYVDGQGRLEDPGPDQVPDPLMTKMVMQKQAASRQAGSVFLFIRFHSDSQAVIGQACQAARTKDLRGEFVGIADKVYDFGDLSGKDRCGYAVFQFPSLTSAEVFYNRDRNIRQPDFPRPFGDIEVFAINLQMDPAAVKSFRTFLLSEVTLNDGLSQDSLDNYEQRFKAPFTRALLRLGALPYAAFCDRGNRRTLKRRYFERNDIVTLHLFRNLEHYKQVWGDREYSDLRSVHDAIARERCSLFVVRPEFCP